MFLYDIHHTTPSSRVSLTLARVSARLSLEVLILRRNADEERSECPVQHFEVYCGPPAEQRICEVGARTSGCNQR